MYLKPVVRFGAEIGALIEQVRYAGNRNRQSTEDLNKIKIIVLVDNLFAILYLKTLQK